MSGLFRRQCHHHLLPLPPAEGLMACAAGKGDGGGGGGLNLNFRRGGWGACMNVVLGGAKGGGNSPASKCTKSAPFAVPQQLIGTKFIC